MVGPYDDMDLRMRNQKQREYYCTVCGVTSLDPIGEDDKRIPKELAAAQAKIRDLEVQLNGCAEMIHAKDARIKELESTHAEECRSALSLLNGKDATIKSLEDRVKYEQKNVDNEKLQSKYLRDRLAKCEKVVDYYASPENWEEGGRPGEFTAVRYDVEKLPSGLCAGRRARAYRAEFPKEDK